MATQINMTPVDRSGWPPGPWDDEGDRVEWRDEVTDLACLAKRNHHGAWCGYVGVPPGHPWHGLDYNDVDADVHGGLTYSAPCAPDIGICHVALPGEPDDLWWFGFDCNHASDIAPAMLSYEPNPGSVYRDVTYTRAECASLAEQVAAAGQ